jgi:hypothetical protein
MVLVLAALAASAGGCSRISDIAWLQTDRQMLEWIARHSQALKDIEARGVIRFEYGGRSGEVPFRVRIGPEAVVQLDAEIAPSALPRLGRLTVVSDASGTQIYGSDVLEDLARANLRPAALRALVLSLCGGGDLLIGWLASVGCVIGKSMSCQGLEVSLNLDRERRAIEKWQVNDKSGKFGLTGLIYAWDGAGSHPRVVTGVIHPAEIKVTVTFNEPGVAYRGIPAGNFGVETALQ